MDDLLCLFPKMRFERTRRHQEESGEIVRLGFQEGIIVLRYAVDIPMIRSDIRDPMLSIDGLMKDHMSQFMGKGEPVLGLQIDIEIFIDIDLLEIVRYEGVDLIAPVQRRNWDDVDLENDIDQLFNINRNLFLQAATISILPNDLFNVRIRMEDRFQQIRVA
jgi:hypothetical protein